MRRSSGHVVALTWLTVLGMTAGPILAGSPPRDTVPVVQDVTADEARSLQGEGRWDEAADAWRAVAEQEPDNGTAWFNLGYCLHAAGRLDEAIRIHKKAATFDDYHGIAMYNLGCAYALAGRPDDALEALAAAQDAGFGLRGRVESDSDLQSLLGNPGLEALLLREPEPSGWRGKARQFTAGAQQFLTGPQVQGMIQKLQGAAQGLLQKMADDERFAGLARKLQAWLGGRQDASARAEADAAPHDEPHAELQGEPDQGDRVEHTGDVVTIEKAQQFQQAADWDNAVEAYRAVLVDQPDHVAGWFGLAYCLHMSGDYESAIEAHKESARFDQTRGIALYNLACAYALTGRPDRALEALEKSRDAGFDISAARRDSDFDNIKDDPRFKTLLAR